MAATKTGTVGKWAVCILLEWFYVPSWEYRIGKKPRQIERTFWKPVGCFLNLLKPLVLLTKRVSEEECIPVGCVPPASVVISGGGGGGGGGGFCPGGMSALEGVYLGAGCLPRSVSAGGGGGLYTPLPIARWDTSFPHAQNE